MQRLLLPLILVLSACGGGGSEEPATASSSSTSSGGASSSGGGGTSGGPGAGTSSSSGAAGGSTFCAIVAVARKTCPSPASQTTNSTSTCEDNLAKCDSSLVPPDKSEKSGSCDVDTHYMLSQKNTTGPHAGTCAQYHRWNDTLDECLDAEDCGKEASFACREGQCFCGEARYSKDLNNLVLKCDGTKVVSARSTCQAGAIKPVTETIKDCAANGEQCKGDVNPTCAATPPPP